MPENTIEEISVKLEADYQDFLKQIDKAVNEAVRKLKEVDDAPRKAKTTWEQLGSFLGGKFLQTVTAVGAAITAAFAVQGVANFFTTIAKASVDANAQFEKFRTQFETLLGDAGKAQKRIDELAEFGAKTPFELDEIVEADRLLQTFGGTVLATGENLRLIGDSAAGVNADFKEVSFWTGRMYAAMQAGRPFGESSARLQELGIMTGETRAQLEEMQKSGASGIEMWAAYSEMIDTRFTGAMDKLSKTFQGVLSNLADLQSQLLREGGAEFFEGVREDAIEFYELVSGDLKPALLDLAKSFGKIADELREAVTGPLLESLSELEAEKVERLADSFSDFAEALGRLAGTDTKNMNSIVTMIDGLVQNTTMIVDLAAGLKDLSLTVSGIRPIKEFLGDRDPVPFFLVAEGLGKINEELTELTGFSLSDWASGDLDKAAESADAAKGAYEGMRQAQSEAAEAAKELADAKADEALAKIAEEAEKAAAALNAAKEAAADLVTEFSDAVKENKAAAEELEADHGEKIVEITEDYKEEQADIVAERDEALIDLEKETAKKRQDIMESTQEALAKLEKDTAKRREEINEKTQDSLAKLRDDTEDSIDKVRKDHQVKEKRETEDHQRDMKRLQGDYLFDLQDAVKSRDARAIVDLRRRFQREKREREQDFKVNQKREDADVGDKIGEIRQDERKRRQEILKNQQQQLEDLAESEAEKREEIMASQAEQLEDLAEHEAEKREQIEESYNEQMEKAEEKYQEEMERENERYEERKQALDEALQKRLEDVAKELADEKDINEKGAKAILEALMKTFGVGGDIDKMMEDFAARRQQKLTIQIDVENDIRDMPGSEDRGTPNERGRMGPPPRRFAKGGLVPGPINAPMDAIVHGGEWVIPHEDVMEMIMTRQSNATGAMNHRFAVDVNMKGIPANMDQRSLENVVAGIFNRALNEAGIGK